MKPKGVPSGPAGDSVTSFAEGPDLTVYLGTEKGAIYRVVDRVAERLNVTYPINAGRVTSLMFEGGRDLLAVFAEAGLYRVNVASAAIAEVPWNEIKAHRHLCCLVRDAAGHVWLGTNKGLFKFK